MCVRSSRGTACRILLVWRGGIDSSRMGEFCGPESILRPCSASLIAISVGRTVFLEGTLLIFGF